MNELRTRLIIIILILAAGISILAALLHFRKSAPVTLILPNFSWERSAFKVIDQATETAQLTPLRKTQLYPNDIEIRIWRGFGLSELEAVILKRNGSQWSAFHLQTDTSNPPFEKAQVEELKEPKSGWGKFWKQMNDQRLLELPDANEIDCDVSIIDGTVYVIEVNQNGTYRTYHYESGIEKCLEAKQMDEISRIISLEFESGLEYELQQCQRELWFACKSYRRKLEQINR